MPFKAIIAEDEEITLKHLLFALSKEGYEITGTRNGKEAWEKIEKNHYDLLIADIKMPGMDGIELLRRVKEKYPETEVMIITGFGSIGSAVEAMRKGAYDYITKPFELDELIHKVQNIKEGKTLRRENIALRTYLGLDRKLQVVAESKNMKRVLELVEGIKDSDCNVLLTGETGVGKGLVARIIHHTSKRKEMPFLSLNCAVFTEELLASELFGHEKGAFTGAIKSKQGLVELADQGTLFLDEIAEMTPALQAKLLKLIEEGEFFRVGGTKPIKVDVRFIAATNLGVKDAISKGKFREDLYYRLNVMEILIQPLRERKEDIKALAEFFLERHLPKYNKKILGLSKEAMEVLKNYSFPGNVRELENLIERAIILEKSDYITPESLPRSLRLFQIETIEPSGIKTMEEISREYAEKVLDYVGGNRTKAAELLGISRTSLWRILKEE
jgi:DNA-binding NtrC family response regulator